MEDVPDENQHERDRIEIPGLDEDRGHHQPTNPVPFRVVVRDQIADGAIHRCLMRVRGQTVFPLYARISLTVVRRSFPSSLAPISALRRVASMTAVLTHEYRLVR